jgi:hypothetical protein
VLQEIGDLLHRNIHLYCIATMQEYDLSPEAAFCFAADAKERGQTTEFAVEMERSFNRPAKYGARQPITLF